MNDVSDLQEIDECAERIRVRGVVQGVGFRPSVWRLAHRHGLRGWVANDGDGVDIHVCGPVAAVDRFAQALARDKPPLARIDAIERVPAALLGRDVEFRIAASRVTGAHTGIVPDAATCEACLHEIADPGARRYRYPFTNCTHCGPRLSIVDAIPYDRAATTMRAFAMCPACRAEYDDPDDRRFHAQPIACPACGPHAWLEDAHGMPVEVSTAARDPAAAIDAARALLLRGHIVAIKGLGGFQLACDACDPSAVARLRAVKRRERKPFALMARDVDVVRSYCAVSAAEATLLQSPAAPIVILDAAGTRSVAAGIAPGIPTLGVMLANTPLHHLLLRSMEQPIVLTSGNLSDEPQCIADDDARARLAGIADCFLLHDRAIAHRVDDSVVRVMAGVPRMLRRARGHAPTTLPLPDGFAAAPAGLAMGGEQKNSFCLLRDGEAIVSHHIGDLDEARTHADYRAAIDSYLRLFEHAPRGVAVDRHPEYRAGKFGRRFAAQRAIDVVEVQHHHAHVASCLADNGYPLDGPPVLGVALDGLGYGDESGDDDALWGGEFLLADYRQCRRVASFAPVAVPGGEQAIHQPWRNTYAHLVAAIGWARFSAEYAALDLHRFLAARPLDALDAMIAGRINSPLASSCGRLFDAVAAATGICRERAHYEGQPAIEFEALLGGRDSSEVADDDAYPFAIARSRDLPRIDPGAMWKALLDDLAQGTRPATIALRFHKGLAIAIVRMVEQLRLATVGARRATTIALSGGVFQNRVLLEQVSGRLAAAGWRVLVHRQVPCNDGGLALGQAVVAAARTIAARDVPGRAPIPALIR